MRPVTILFAKAPIAGRVKTRLTPLLTPAEAAALHEAFAADVLETLAQLDADVELHLDEPSDAWAEFPGARRLQCPGDLGARMLHAFEGGLAAGHPSVMIVGADAPDVPADNLAELLAADADVALGPAEDGGYYAIAARRTDPRMFAGVEWSSPSAMAGTERALAECGLTCTRGRVWRDVDEPADLRRLAASPRLPPRTERVLKSLAATLKR